MKDLGPDRPVVQCLLRMTSMGDAREPSKGDGVN